MTPPLSPSLDLVKHARDVFATHKTRELLDLVDGWDFTPIDRLNREYRLRHFLAEAFSQYASGQEELARRWEKLANDALELHQPFIVVKPIP